MRNRRTVLSITTLILVVVGVYAVQAWDPLPLDQDPLVRMPGTQPEQVTLEDPNRCFNCHSGYDTDVEPGFNWKGSMMAQSARDFLFFACMTVAGQDSTWAIDRPNAVDICERCHFPKGWLEGRSDPTNASAMTDADYDGVQCDFCHTLYDPFFETTYSGEREGNDWLDYWDETNASETPSQPAANTTYAEDATQAQDIHLFNGNTFFGDDNLPVSPYYVEHAAGQYYVSAGAQKRASFADADARHQMFYSRHHKSRYFCDSCHDVSNPVLANLDFEGTPPGDGVTVLTTENEPAYAYLHVERTFSEFMLSDFGLQGGAPGTGPFAPDVFDTSYPNNYIAKCQDCHMPDMVGKGAKLNGALIRPDESIEHPNSGQPVHDLTGGNAWVSHVLASTVAGSPTYDPMNDQLLNQGPAALTLDLTQGLGIDPVPLLAGVDRAQQELLMAASIQDLTFNSGTGEVSFRVQNHTGHKLISGFPEGRRMFINVRAYDASGALVFEINPYDPAAGTLKGLDYNYQPGFGLPVPLPLDPNSEEHEDELVYEAQPSSSLTGEEHTFHFALADDRYKDNRIPPQGFRLAEADDRLSLPVWEGVPEDPDAPFIYTPAEYQGGYDQVSVDVPPGADSVDVNLYYQTTSREYVEFLRDEINANPNNRTLPDPAYIIQADPFFGQLKAWGDTMWQLWVHNMNVAGALPFLMAQATAGGGGCPAPVPDLLSAEPGDGQVTLTWSDEHGTDPNVTGYRVYYDLAGDAQLVTEVGLTTSYVDSSLTNGEEYCYKVTSLYPGCESDFSNILCATPSSEQGTAGVTHLLTGYLDNSGGTWKLVLSNTFSPGDLVIMLARVVDTGTSLPLAGAVVEITISGPVGTVRTSNASGATGWGLAWWKTQTSTPAGSYVATVTNVTAEGYTWDGVETSHGFTIQ